MTSNLLLRLPPNIGNFINSGAVFRLEHNPFRVKRCIYRL